MEMKCFIVVAISIIGLVQFLAALPIDDLNNPAASVIEKSEHIAEEEIGTNVNVYNHESEHIAEEEIGTNVNVYNHESEFPSATVEHNPSNIVIKNATTTAAAELEIYIYDYDMPNDWLPPANITNLNTAIASAPPQLHASLLTLAKDVTEYNLSLDNVRRSAIESVEFLTDVFNNDAMFVIQSVHKTVNLLSDATKLNDEYEENVGECSDQLQDVLVLFWKKINEKLIEFNTLCYPMTEDELQNVKVEIQELSKLIQTANAVIKDNIENEMDVFQKCVQDKTQKQYVEVLHKHIKPFKKVDNNEV